MDYSPANEQFINEEFNKEEFLMKNLTNNNFSYTSLLILSILFIESCSSIKTAPILPATPDPKLSFRPTMPAVFKNYSMKGYNKICSEVVSSLPPRFENFDRQPYANESYIIANMIAVVQPELDEEQRDIIASQISIAIKKFDIEPQIMVAIIDTESNFNSEKVSSTGDLSVGQINVEVWNKEFKRMNMTPMIKEKIKDDQEYALMKMAEILSIIKKRNEKNDRRWYARYHSNTLKYKTDYLHKLEIRMKMLATSETLNSQIAQVKNLKILATNSSSSLPNQISQMNTFTSELLTIYPTPMPKLTPKAPETLESIDVIATLKLKELLPISAF